MSLLKKIVLIYLVFHIGNLLADSSAEMFPTSPRNPLLDNKPEITTIAPEQPSQPNPSNSEDPMISATKSKVECQSEFLSAQGAMPNAQAKEVCTNLTADCRILVSSCKSGGGTPSQLPLAPKEDQKAPTPQATQSGGGQHSGGGGAQPQSQKQDGSPAPTSISDKQTPSSVVQPANSSGDPTMDQNTCQSLMQKAVRCCNDPSQCGAPANSNYSADGGGISGSCNQMKQDGALASNGQYTGADICIQNYTNCHDSCLNMASTYSTNSSVASSLTGNAQTCAQLRSRADTLNQISQSSLNAATGGQNCNNAASSASPQSTSPNSGASPSATPQSSASNTDPNAQSCTQNPDSATCKALNAGAQVQKGTAGFADASAAPHGTKASDFNVDPLDSVRGQNAFKNVEAQAEKVTPIPNGGGGMPGGAGGGSGQAASPGSSGLPRGSAGNTQVADIDKGLRSGGYSTTPGGGSEDGAGGFSGYGNGSGGRGPASVSGGGLDLKRYLPGGKYDPTRHLGGMNGTSPEINTRASDLFLNISNRFQEKCRLGELLDCK